MNKVSQAVSWFSSLDDEYKEKAFAELVEFAIEQEFIDIRDYEIYYKESGDIFLGDEN